MPTARWLTTLGATLGLLMSSGCLVLDDDSPSDAVLRTDVELYWEEEAPGDGAFACSTAGVDLMAYRLRDRDGDIVDCVPQDEDGNCVADPAECDVIECTPPPNCLDRISFRLDPGEYALEIDGLRSDCAEPAWQVRCTGIFVDRFNEQYSCDVPLTTACGQDGGDGDAAPDVGM